MLFIPLLVSLLGAQVPEETPVFRSDVANVRIDVQATQNGRLIADLTKEDFEVLDSGKTRPVLYFGRESEPLSLVLLLDVSGSMRPHVEQVAAVARESLRFLRVVDRVSVMVFAREARVHLDWTSNMPDVADAVRTAVYDEKLGAGTSINDALLEAARYIGKMPDGVGRRAVLILSDNTGLNYQSPDDPVIEALQRADAVLNGIVVGRGQRPERVSGGMYRNPDFTSPDIFGIAERTGGEAVKADKAGKAFYTMIERIRTRYSLQCGIPADARAGTYRPLEVRLTPEAQKRYPKAELRHRPGYRVPD